MHGTRQFHRRRRIERASAYEDRSGVLALTVTNVGGEFGSAFRCVEMRPHLSQR
jgi:hypothetical protein